MNDALDELIRHAEIAAEDRGALQGFCSAVATFLDVEICSVYVRERDAERRVAGELVLSASHGQPRGLVGKVRLRVGDGLTGFAVDCLRPVTVAIASRDARNRQFDGIDEEAHPGFLAVPLVDGGTAIGALVLQRKEARAFEAREIARAQAAAAIVAFAIGRARAVTTTPPDAAARRPTEVSLHGRLGAPGSALGTAAVRSRAIVGAAQQGAVNPIEERARLGQAIAETADEIAALAAWATDHAPLDRATMTTLLAPSRYVLDDARLRGRMLKEVQGGLAAEQAVERVVAEYARHLGAADDGALRDRALEVEALALRVCMRLAGRTTPFEPGAILCASRVTACDVLELTARHGGGLLIEGPAEDSPGLPLALALKLPVLTDVTELFRWVADGDRLLLRADERVAVLNPSRVDVAAFRRT